MKFNQPHIRMGGDAVLAVSASVSVMSPQPREHIIFICPGGLTQNYDSTLGHP